MLDCCCPAPQALARVVGGRFLCHAGKMAEDLDRGFLMTSMVRHLVVAAALGMIAQGVWAQGDPGYVAGGLGGSPPPM